jgi:hypothetical protein
MVHYFHISVNSPAVSTSFCRPDNLTQAWSRRGKPRGSYPQPCVPCMRSCSGVKVPRPGICGAEGPGKRQGVAVRWGLKEAWNAGAGRGTRTGYEVWYARDEWARHHKVLHPQLGRTVYIRRLGTEGVTAGDLRGVLDRTEGGGILPDRPAEVSRGHRRPGAGDAREAPHGRKAGPQRGGAVTRVGRRPERWTGVGA